MTGSHLPQVSGSHQTARGGGTRNPSALLPCAWNGVIGATRVHLLHPFFYACLRPRTGPGSGNWGHRKCKNPLFSRGFLRLLVLENRCPIRLSYGGQKLLVELLVDFP